MSPITSKSELFGIGCILEIPKISVARTRTLGYGEETLLSSGWT